MDVLLQFPGQLSEHVGMARVALQALPESARRLEEAERETGLPVAALVAGGPEAALHADRAAAVAMVTVDVMMLDALAARVSPAVRGVAGHSVGFDAALVAAGVLDLPQALEVVLRVDEAVDRWMAREGVRGAMGVVVGLSADDVAALCPTGTRCAVACVNAATQAAVSGDAEAVDQVLAAARARGALAVHRMPVEKPMHGPWLGAVVPELRAKLAAMPLGEPRLPVVSHLDGKVVRGADEARELLASQIAHSVGWRDAVRALVSLAPGAALLECGPGDVLTRLARWIDRTLPARALSDPAQWPVAVARA